MFTWSGKTVLLCLDLDNQINVGDSSCYPYLNNQQCQAADYATQTLEEKDFSYHNLVNVVGNFNQIIAHW